MSSSVSRRANDEAVVCSGDLFRLQRCELPIINRVYEERKVTSLDGSVHPMRVFIPREEGDFLYSMIRHARPTSTLEVGMANGISTLFIAQGLRENGQGKHVAIDPFQTSDWKGAGLTALRSAGLDSFVRLVEKRSYQALPEIEASGERVQFAFIDGSHLFDYVMADFLCCDRVLEVGGLMAFDDSDWPSVTSVLRYALTNRRYEVAFPEIVIEPVRVRPSIAARLLRSAGRVFPQLGRRLRHDFTVPSHELAIKGRCVVLRKMAHDDRDLLRKFHLPF